MISNPYRSFALSAVLLGLFGACTASTPSAREPQGPEPLPTSTPNDTAGAPAGGSGGSGSAAGGVVGTGGAPERMCGGIAALRCPEKQYCSYAPEARCGAGDMSGTCAPIPDMCTQQLDEVCGCDGKTYGNACTAAQAGISVTMKGPCAKPPTASDTTPEGGLCGTRGVPKDCAPGLYCAYKSDCGATDTGGVCTKRTNMCTKIYQPVCGCDGKTYGNACTAAAAGASVAKKGECASK